MKAGAQVLWCMGENDPIGLCVWMLGPQLVERFERIRRCGLIREGVSLRAGFEISKYVAPSVSLSQSLICRLKM